MKERLTAVIALVAMVASACSAGTSTAAPAGQSAPTRRAASASPTVSGLAGRWEQDRQCQNLVDALDQAGLGATAPAAVGDFFPNESAKQLAKKPRICSGAEPSPHSHFFNSAGQFGSLDQNQSQVDNGQYTLVNAHVVKINGADFHYSIRGGNTLSLDPVITTAQRRKALANPLKFSTAVWMVTVAYPGTTWKRVPCGSWC